MRIASWLGPAVDVWVVAFKIFLEEICSIYGDLLLYTEVKWPSREKCLVRDSELRKETDILQQFYKIWHL
jgi:hypothetical protein